MRRLRTLPALTLALALAALLAACAAPSGPGEGRQACGPHPAVLTNASSLPVEQIYLGTGAPSGWGANLLDRGDLPSGGSLRLTLPGTGPQALRAVWANGRAAELAGIDGCRTSRITVLDAALRAE